MKPESKRLWGSLRTSFFRGLGVIIPLILTYWVLQAFLNAVDGILSPILEDLLGRQIPGLGLLSMLVIILLVGLLTRNIAGRLFFAWFESVLRSIPFVRAVYTAIKDLVGAFTLGDKSKTFRHVVMVEYPRRGVYAIGFVTNEMSVDRTDGTRSDLVNIYVPNPPNPTSGQLVLVPKEDAVPLAMSIEEGLKLSLSGGIVVPGQVRALRPHY